ncbi:MAG: HAD-IIB family hydrolase [Deltaproteobacteria bacterium]|nr:HAD-IIB family hydrolase [Deltaproteobacteria bacterium]MBI3295364.1 HAD-IIB family hydrolase [Deltaproteobacteria bacterium]
MTLKDLPAKKVRAVFTDLDDTLTDDQRISSETYRVLWELKKAGFWLVIVSGRPAGWADALTRLWPIDHMIFENGAGWSARDGHKVVTTRLVNGGAGDLSAIFARLKEKVPALKPASDQRYRLHDYAIDFAEEPPFLDSETVNWCLSELAREPGVTAKVSSIHINFWRGTHTKVTACEALLQREGAKRRVGRDEVAFVGDSPNDEPLFEFFPNAVGVANVAPFLGKMKSHPRFLTQEKGGKGFEELAHLLLDSQRKNS